MPDADPARERLTEIEQALKRRRGRRRSRLGSVSHHGWVGLEGPHRDILRGGYGGGPGDATGFSVRYQGELLGISDLQNRDPRRKSPPETEKNGWLIITPSVSGGC